MRVEGLGFRVEGSGIRVQGPKFRVQGSGFRVQGRREARTPAGSRERRVGSGALVDPCLVSRVI